MNKSFQIQAFIAHLSAGRTQEANVVLAAAVAASPEDTGPYALLIGGMLARKGRHADAVPLYQESIHINPGNPSAYFYLGVTYHALNEPTERDQVWDQLSDKFPDHALTYYQQALRFLILNNYVRARSSLQQAAEKLEADHPLRNDALTTLALIEEQLLLEEQLLTRGNPATGNPVTSRN